MKSQIALALVAGFVALLGAELAVRLVHPAGPLLGRVQIDAPVRRALFERDVELIQRLRPGATADLYAWEQRSSVRVNSLGLRGPEPADPVEGPRILALGDSFTLALQVEEDQAWPSILQAALREQLDQPVEVLNGGCDDYGTSQQVRLLDRLAPILRPDLVIVAFYLGNDLRDNLRQLPRPRQGKPSRRQPQAQPQAAAAGWSHLAHWVQYQQARRRGGESPQVARQRAEELQIWTDPRVLDSIGHATKSALAALADRCATHQTRCLLAIAPPELVVRPAVAASRLATYGIAVESVDLHRPARMVASWTPATLPVIDLTAVLSDHEGAGLYLRQDGHWTPKGHAVVAGALVEPVVSLVRSSSAPADTESADLSLSD